MNLPTATQPVGARSRHPALRLRLRVWLLLAGTLAAVAGGVAARVITEPRPFCQQALVPAYFYQGADWTTAIDSKPPPRFMILDITGSGAGSSPDRNYQAAVERARAAGITIVGYSDTDYTRRPAATVESDVAHYKSWYGVTDIFLDGVSAGDGGLPYYRQLSDYIHAANPGSVVILNPGVYPDRSYLSIGDIVLVFEGSYAEYGNLKVPAWADDYPAGKFAYVIYGAARSQLNAAISMSRRRHAGYVYVTASTGANPYSSMPGYWTSENAIIAACGGLPAGVALAARAWRRRAARDNPLAAAGGSAAAVTLMTAMLALATKELAASKLPLAVSVPICSKSFSAERYSAASTGGIGPLRAARASAASFAPALLAAVSLPARWQALIFPMSVFTALSSLLAVPVSHLAPRVTGGCGFAVRIGFLALGALPSRLALALVPVRAVPALGP
jgi:hypothetical protein